MMPKFLFENVYKLKNTPTNEHTEMAQLLFLHQLVKFEKPIFHELFQWINKEEIPEKTFDNEVNNLFRSFLDHSINKNNSIENYPQSWFDTPLVNYITLLNSLDGQIKKLENEWRSEFDRVSNGERFCKEMAVYELIPNWNTLQNSELARMFVCSMAKWAASNNMNETWFIDIALTALNKFKVHFLSPLALRNNSTSVDEDLTYYLDQLDSQIDDAVIRAFDVISSDESEYLYIKNETLKKIKGLESKFTWRDVQIKFSWDPFYISRKKFIEYAEDNLLLEIGKKIDGFAFRNEKFTLDEIINLIRIFRKKLNKYCDNIEKQIKSVAEKSGQKKTYKHLHWFFEYQLPPCKNYHELGTLFGNDKNSIKGGIKSAAQLLGITLRNPDSSGRPEGKKDSENKRINIVRHNKKGG